MNRFINNDLSFTEEGRMLSVRTLGVMTLAVYARKVGLKKLSAKFERKAETLDARLWADSGYINSYDPRLPL